MKTNKMKKIVVSTLAVAMGAALVGSISGTVAWYQYSTRVTAQMSGTSAGTSRNLQIANSDVVVEDEHNAAWGYNVKPGKKADMAPSTVTLGEDGVVNGHREHPVYQYFNGWNQADANDYFSYDLYFQSLKQGNEREEVDVYLTAFELKNAAGNADLEGIIADALRIEFAVYNTADGSDWELVADSNKIFALAEGTTSLKDYLNLNNRDGGENYVMDHNGFAADDSDGVATMYQASTAVAGAIGDSGAGLFSDPALKHAAEVDGSGKLTAAGTYYKLGADHYDAVTVDDLLTDDTDAYAFKDSSDAAVDGSTKLFSTSEDYAVKMTVKIWIEGWQQTEDPASVVLPEGTEATGYFSDDTLETAANNYHSVDATAGETSAEGLYNDTACTEPVSAVDGKVETSGTYYAKGVAAGTYYTKGYIWSDESINTGFQINMRFGCEAER